MRALAANTGLENEGRKKGLEGLAERKDTWLSSVEEGEYASVDASNYSLIGPLHNENGIYVNHGRTAQTV